MTAQELAARLLESRKGLTVDRIAKAQARAQQFKLSWDEVLAAMSSEQRQQVEQAQ